MARALFFVLAAILIVATIAEELEGYENTMEDFFMAEKRGKNMKKYKSCDAFGQSCYCSRRTSKVVFCSGAGNGDSM